MKATAMMQAVTHEPQPTTSTRRDDPRGQAERVRALNDSFRTGSLAEAWGLGRISITPGVNALSEADKYALMQQVKQFNDFSEANDPHGEHDFGAIDYKGVRYFWKIDYYDQSLKHGSPNPADAAVTCRVLTVMQASEY